MELYGGMDLHSTNVVTKLIDEVDKVVYRKKKCCDLEQILKVLNLTIAALQASRSNRRSTGIG